MQSFFFCRTLPHAYILPTTAVTHFLKRVSQLFSEGFFGVFCIIVSKSAEKIPRLQTCFAIESYLATNQISLLAFDIDFDESPCFLFVLEILRHTTYYKQNFFAFALVFTFFVEFVEQFFLCK